jgi:hypothetical protein
MIAGETSLTSQNAPAKAVGFQSRATINTLAATRPVMRRTGKMCRRCSRAQRHLSIRPSAPLGVSVVRPDADCRLRPRRRSQTQRSTLVVCPKESPMKRTRCGTSTALEHDPEKWKPVFGKDYAPTQYLDHDQGLVTNCRSGKRTWWSQGESRPLECHSIRTLTISVTY